jgi:quinolinate synthase
MHLGNYVSTQLPDVEIITYPGYCPTHLRILPQDILDLREEYPEAKVLADPECHKEVIKLADFTGSTTQIMKYCAESKKHSFIIATEKGVVERLDATTLKNFYDSIAKSLLPKHEMAQFG